MIVVRVVVTGKVQGVWFRAWTVEEASMRGLRGWVRNRGDGSVEALFAGEAAMVEDMIDACRNGPPMARVGGIERYVADAESIPEGFDQLSTV